jgi:hypothetical protein
MKIRMLAVSLIDLMFICTALADDLPRIGYSVRTPLKDLVAKRYRWVTVDGPYACVTEQEVRQITSNRTDLMELHPVEDGYAYYLIPGALVQVTRDDPANGMSKTLLGKITKPLWTYFNFLIARAEMIISLLALVAAIYLIAQRIGFVRWRREYELSIDRLIRAIHPGREGGSAVEW